MTPEQNTDVVYLTEQEADRIRKTTKDKLRKCSELEGQRRKPRNPKDSISQAINASLMADMGGVIDFNTVKTNLQGDRLPVLSVGQHFSPSILSLKDLKPMNLTELEMETHHRGRRLTVHRVSPVVMLGARSWTIVKDENGDEVERLEICLHKMKHGDEVLDSSSIFVIKEPYFTLSDQGEVTIRVDHPSDLIVFDDEHVERCSKFTKEMDDTAEDGTEAERFARMLKDEGNTALEQNDLPLAYKRYGQGLKIATQSAMWDAFPDLARDILRNRAHVNLRLHQLDEAIADSIASISGKQDERSKLLDGKAYFRAGSAAYNLGRYQEAKRFFEQRKEHMPDEKNLAANLRRVQKRICEEESASYDLKKISASLSRSHPCADTADFTRNIEVKESIGRGRGIFSTSDIAIGDIIMCEKAFCVVWGHEIKALTAITYDVRDDMIRVSPIGLTSSIVEKVLNNPSQLEKVMSLFGDYQGEHNHVSSTEDGPVVDVFRIHDIVCRNAFGLGDQFRTEDETNSSTGLWIWASYINHSCIPNSSKEYIGDLMVLRATRHINAGEEIFHAYTQAIDFETRQQALMTTWGFECGCALCTAEAADDPVLRRQRTKLSFEADAFVENEHWANAKRLTIARAERLLLAINGTYDGERFHNLPRTAAQGIEGWLARARRRR